MSDPRKQTARLLGRITELLDDINDSLLELDPQAKTRFARQFARLYSLMQKVQALQDANGKGE